MASQGGVAGAGTSRLAQMQMRFQQRQQQEREQRKMEMTGSKLPLDVNDTTTITRTTVAATGTAKSLNSTLGPGKVRQMFDERRRGAGIDRSHPLKPIVTSRSSSSGSSTLTTSTGSTTTVRKQQISTVKYASGQRRSSNTSVSSHGSISRNGNNNVSSHSMNGNSIKRDGYLNDEADGHLDNDGFKLPNIGKMSLSNVEDRNNNNSSSEGRTSIKLKPVVMKKTMPAEGRTNGFGRTGATPTSNFNQTEKAVKQPAKNIPNSTKPKMATSAAVKSPAPRISTPPPGTVPCKNCGRFFNSDRIEKHEQICQKTTTKKRKPFDVTKHRVQGTEAEAYVLKKKPTRAAAASKTPAANAKPTDGAKKSNWRQKHEEFIAAIRAAKQVQAHLAKGGKLSDLPPPPPSENPDYIQCPHCSRRFNETAANRHIPKCATMLHNKPKPGATSAKRR